VATNGCTGVEKSTTSGRLFFLDLAAGRVLSANPDGSDLKTIINEGRKLPDGLVNVSGSNRGGPVTDTRRLQNECSGRSSSKWLAR
jgi:hypothetical protein